MSFHTRFVKVAVLLVISLTVTVLLTVMLPNSYKSELLDGVTVKQNTYGGSGKAHEKDKQKVLNGNPKQKNIGHGNISLLKQLFKRMLQIISINIKEGKLIASLEDREISADGIKLLFSGLPIGLPYRRAEFEPFIAESRIDEKERNISLVCVSEPYISNCYEHGSAGFASFLLSSLDHLRLCQQNNGVPSIRWHNCFGGCKPDLGVDSFPFYFKPLNFGIENNAKTVLCLGTFVDSYNDLFLNGLDTKSDAKKISKLTKKGIFTPVLNFSFRPRTGLHKIYSPRDIVTEKLRYEMNSIINRYLKVNANIMNKVKFFYSKYMKDRNMLGIHVRGTDHWTESADLKLPNIEQWIVTAKKILESLEQPKGIFLATDNQETIDRFMEYFGKHTVSKILAI